MLLMAEIFHSVRSNTPEYVCVGGISGDTTQYGTCGDFAGKISLFRDTKITACKLIECKKRYKVYLSTLVKILAQF